MFFRKTEEEHYDPNLSRLRELIAKIALPEHVKTVVDREIDLLSRAGSSTSEYTIGFAYVEYILSLPWETKTEDVLDIPKAEVILSQDHYGLRTIKERILEHLAVKKLKLSRKPNLLVVDDEEIVRRNMTRILTNEGYSVQTALNGKQALEIIADVHFDVVLTDLKMDRIDGLEVLEKIKIHAPSTEVIIITGYSTVNTAVEAMKRGAFHYVAKPFEIDEVRRIVKQALNSRAVRMDMRGPVLCFAGPPGTGKTSMGRSIARALGRKFSRISLGGVKDEAEIRGHRRTYAGAMPGRIIDEIRRVGSMNPLIILDELDKIGHDFKGDPAAALLEALDPEQNNHFTDHYLDVPFDLSDVMFIITANVAENILAPLRDRMEIIQFSGYTENEKYHIAAEYLIPRQIHENGLDDLRPEFEPAAVQKIIQEYTYEAGIRNLNREIASVCRKIATEHVRRPNGSASVAVTPEMVENFLGPRRYLFETVGEHDRIGVSTGLVWTDVGGELIFIEAVRMKGKHDLILTGSLGEVMRESARTALSYIRSNALRYDLPEDFFHGHDIHIHVPAGAIPKDGPSAGLAIALAIFSLLTGRPAKKDVAVSGELTLSGRLLPVGGIKEKILAAKRARINVVLFPSKNKPDVTCIQSELPEGLKIVFCDDAAEAVSIVLK